MPTTYKVLGQLYPSAATLSTLYTTPSSTSSVGSTITICNLSANPDTFRVAIRVGGASISNEDYLFFEESIAGFSTVTLTAGITLATTDIVSVYSTNGTCSFNLFGSEIS
jgi:hypothetical protein